MTEVDVNLTPDERRAWFAEFESIVDENRAWIKSFLAFVRENPIPDEDFANLARFGPTAISEMLKSLPTPSESRRAPSPEPSLTPSYPDSPQQPATASELLRSE